MYSFEYRTEQQEIEMYKIPPALIFSVRRSFVFEIEVESTVQQREKISNEMKNAEAVCAV